MSDVIEMWRISDFCKKANEIFQKVHPNETVHQNTIAIWFNDLEEKGIHYVNRDTTRSDWKVFDEMDLKIAIFIMEKRLKQPGQQQWTLPAIYQAVESECEVRDFPVTHNFSPETVSLETLIKKLDVLIEGRYKGLEADIEKKATLLLDNQKLQDQKNEEKQRLAFIELLEFQSSLRKKAEAEWEKEPEEKRFIKKLFRKEENWKERDRFINEYIERETLYWLNKKESSQAE